MSPISPEGTRFDSSSAFVQDWVQRLRDKKPFDTLRNNPIMGADSRELPQIEDYLGKLKEQFEQRGPGASLDPEAIKTGEELGNAFLRRQKYLQNLSGGAVKPLSERLVDFAYRSGADIGNLNTQNFGGLLHETISHDLPYQAGFSPDYTEKQIRGYRIPASSISPLNEALATQIDTSGHFGTKIDARRAFIDPHNDRLENFYRSQGDYAASMSDVNRPSYTNRELETNPEFVKNLNTFQRESVRSNPFYEIRDRLLKGEGTEGDARVQLDLEEANRLFDWKFTKPLKERWENLAQVQAPSSISKDFLPSWMSKESLLYGYPGKEGLILRGFDPKITGRNRLLNLGQNLTQYVSDPDITRFGGGSQMLFGVDPLGAAASTAWKGLKNNPGGALAGAAVSALNPEVARAVEKDDYKTAGTTVARDVALGAVTEAGLKAVAPTVASRLPAVAAALAPVARFANPALTGAALIAEGRRGSLTDVITRKAGEHPISWLPSAKPNPRTDLGARAGRALSNEGNYIFRTLAKGRIPYFNYK